MAATHRDARSPSSRSGVPVRARLPTAPILVLLSALSFGHARAQRIPLMEEHSLRAESVDEEYVIQIGLPDGYAEDSRRYPVVYVLDAEKSFGLVRDVVDWLSWAGEIPPMVVVGISYGEDRDAWWSKRSRDLTPSPDRSRTWGEWPLAGGAAEFRAFLAHELIPFVDSTYRVTSERTLVGLSFGGLFGAYDLLHADRSFGRYLLVSPAFAWDHEMILELQARFRRAHEEMPIALYVAVGDRDEAVILDSWERWNEALARSAFSGLWYVTEKIAGETHISVFPPAVTRGLKAVTADTLPQAGGGDPRGEGRGTVLWPAVDRAGAIHCCQRR